MFKLFPIRITVFWIAAAAILFLTSSAQAITIQKSPSPAAVGKPVAFKINLTVTAVCNILMDFGDGSNAIIPSANISGGILTIRHTYTRPGLYTVSVASDGNCGTVPLPDPATTTIRVADLSINRIELKFDNNQPRITVKKNEQIKGLAAKINFTGSGHLQGYWEVDGQKRMNVYKSLHKGPYINIKYPELPPLSTFIPGTHRVRFIITHPRLDITFPQAIYFVRADSVERFPIALILPEADTECNFVPTLFNWKNVKRASAYHIRFYTDKTDETIFSAYTKNSDYNLRQKPLKSRFESGQSYRWQVFALDQSDNIVAQSKVRSFSFQEALAYLPGVFMVITDKNAGPGFKTGIIDEFNAAVVDEYPINALNLTVTIFSTDLDIFDVMEAIKNRPGVVLSQPDYIYETFSEPLSDMQKLDQLIGLAGHNITDTGKGIAVAVVDTAVDESHQDLSGAVLLRKDFLENSGASAEIHGTGVAGLIAARINAFGMQGIAPNAGILALRACRQISRDHPRGECYSHAVIKALDAGMQEGASIINLSIGMRGEDPLLARLIRAGNQRNIMFVAPVGNQPDMAAANFPASHPGVIAVCGVLPDGSFYPNQRAAGLADMAVPCSNLLTTIPGNDHNFMSGTSMSSAVVSGLLALCREADPGFNLEAFRAFDGRIEDLLSFLEKN